MVAASVRTGPRRMRPRARGVSALRGLLAPILARLSETLLPPDTIERLRTEREWMRWVNSLTEESLDDLAAAPADVKRRLFKSHVRLVEIETHAKCNRICPFCPNSIVDRRRNGETADRTMLDRVFDELGSIDYSGQIKVARYSEPLTNTGRLYECIASARARVPQAELAIVTNTDYLNADVLRELRSAGLDVVYMSIYLKTNERWSQEIATLYSERLSRKLNAPITRRDKTAVSIRCVYSYDGLELRSACMDYDNYGTDRGSSLEQYTENTRVGPCREPFETFVIDFNGSVMPCCNLRSDLPQHREFVVGELNRQESSIFDIYAGQLSAWRRGVVDFGAKGFPCATCRHRDLTERVAPPIALALTRRLEQIGRETSAASRD
jgi:MoaA/NifB/PqqE/SkfB family radical SAM enzyme